MPFGWRKRKRFERVASLELPPGQWERAWIGLRRRDVLGRIALALLAAVIICSVIRGWDPPFSLSHRLYAAARHRGHGAVHKGRPGGHAGRAATGPQPGHATSTCRTPSRWCSLRAKLRNTLVELTAAPTLDKLDPKIWKEFQPPPPDGSCAAERAKEREEQFRKFRAAFTPQESLDRVEKAMAEVFAPFEDRGLLDKLEREERAGKPGGDRRLSGRPSRSRSRRVRVSDVLIGDGTAIRDSLRKHPSFRPWPTGCSPGCCRG